MRVNTQPVTRSLACTLTEKEWAEKSESAALLVKEIAEAEAEKTLAAKQAKESIDALEAKLRQLSTEIREHQETRAVECRGQYDDRRNLFELVRQDTGEVILSRAMTAEERQEELPFGGVETQTMKEAKALLRSVPGEVKP